MVRGGIGNRLNDEGLVERGVKLPLNLRLRPFRDDKVDRGDGRTAGRRAGAGKGGRHRCAWHHRDRTGTQRAKAHVVEEPDDLHVWWAGPEIADQQQGIPHLQPVIVRPVGVEHDGVGLAAGQVGTRHKRRGADPLLIVWVDADGQHVEDLLLGAGQGGHHQPPLAHRRGCGDAGQSAQGRHRPRRQACI